MHTFWTIVLITIIASIGGTGLGGLVGAMLKKDSSKIVSLLLSFAAGVMLAIVCFDLLPSAISQNIKNQTISILITICGVLVGYGVIHLLNFIIDKNTNKEVDHINETHPKTADDLDELIHADHYKVHKNSYNKNHYELFIAGIVMALAIALHNLPEGMVIGSSFSTNPEDLFKSSGLIVAIIIGLHNIPEGMAVSVPLIAGGTKKSKAIILTALTGVPTVVGAIIGFYLGIISPIWLTISLSFASGAMLYVVFGELLPEAILMWKSKIPAIFALIGLLIGLVVVFF